MLRLLWTTGAVCAVCLLSTGPLAQPASAAGLSPPVADCNAHGKLTRHYTVVELQSALAGMPAAVAEYSNCYDVIQQALYAEISGKHLTGGTGSGGGSFLPTWLIVVLALLVLGGVGFTAYAWRRREAV